jgi:protein involved in polysaccharide export with SLBB domain
VLKVVVFAGVTLEVADAGRCGGKFGIQAVSARKRSSVDVLLRPMGGGLALVVVLLLSGCNSILNSWLDPTQLGAFDKNRTMEIRSTLTIEDSPPGIPGAVYPTPADREVIVREYRISPGDILDVEIYELRRRDFPFERRVSVSAAGEVNIPVLRRVQATGQTVREFENELIEQLRDRRILMNPQVTVNAEYLQKNTYSLFGVGASASTGAGLRAGTFPLRRPDMTILEVVNQLGGLNELVSDLYVFRYDEPLLEPEPPIATEPVSEEPAGRCEVPSPPVDQPPAGPGPEEDVDESVEESPEAELIEAVLEQPDQNDEDREVPDDLQVESAQPWIWLNDEFVPNPAYEQTEEQPEESLEQVARSKAEGPTVDWERIAGERNYRIIRVPAGALRAGDPEFNIYIRGGDVIRVVSGEVGLYYVMGQVNRRGVFAFSSEAVTLKTAIAAANGLSSLAWPDRCTIYRRLGQREQMIQVNLDRIFAGKDPDFFIKRGDIINVGTHPFAPFLQRIRQWTLPTPRNNVGYSFTYSRNFADIDSFGSRQNPHNEPDRFPGLFP